MTDPAIDYTSRDFQSTRTSLVNWVKIRFKKDWQEFVDTSIGKAILDIVAWAHAQRAFYYDMQALNCYLETATLPEAAMALVKQMGYQRGMKTAASVPVTFYPSPPQTVAIIVEKGEKIAVDDMIFEAGETYLIPAGKTSWPDSTTDEVMVFVEGETKTDSFVSDGTEFQTFPSSQNDIIHGSLVVTVDDVEWEEVDSLILIEGTSRGRDAFIGDGTDDQSFALELLYALIDLDDEDKVVVIIDGEKWKMVEEFTGAPEEFRATQAEDGTTQILFGSTADGAAPDDGAVIDVIYQVAGSQKRYTVDYNKNGKATVGFGDGEDGLVPPENTVITLSYRVGGGVKTNIPRGQINGNIRGKLASGAGVNVRVYNHEAGTGGEDMETIEHLKLMAPRFASTHKKAVTPMDWKTLPAVYRDPLYGSPAFATARLKQQKPELNTVEIILWSRDSGGRIAAPTSGLKQGVKSYMDSLRTYCTYIEVVDGDIMYFDIQFQLKLKNGKSLAYALEPVTAVIRDYFNSALVTPGADLILSSINRRVQDLSFVEASVVKNVIGSKLDTVDFGQGDGITTEYSGYIEIPSGMTMIPGSFELSDGVQKINDDGNETLTGDMDETGTNTINYATGKFVGTFADAPATDKYVTAEARFYSFMALDSETATVDAENSIDGMTNYSPIVERPPRGIDDGQSIQATLPQIFAPYSQNRLLFIGGYDKDATQPGGQLLAYDDGDGNIVGDVFSGGTVDYDTGEVSFTWNTTPPPVAYATYYGRLLQAPDGSLKTFDFEVRTASGGGGSRVSLETLNGVGRTKFLFSDLATPNVDIEDGWDNSQGVVNGGSLNERETNTITYEDATSGFAEGVVTFLAAPEVAAGQDFEIKVVPVTVFHYAAFAAFLKSGANYERIIFADNNGKFYGDMGEQFPYSKLDHLSGRYVAKLELASITGRTLRITYDSYVQSDCRNIPVDDLTMPAFSTVSLEEIVELL